MVNQLFFNWIILLILSYIGIGTDNGFYKPVSIPIIYYRVKPIVLNLTLQIDQLIFRLNNFILIIGELFCM